MRGGGIELGEGCNELRSHTIGNSTLYSHHISVQKAMQIRLFTYALGTGADTSILARLAANHGGMLHQVADGGDLPNVMARYYQGLEDSGSRDTNAVRWMRYSDIVSNTTLLAGCVALDDLSSTGGAGASSVGGATSTLFGVVCMDANIVTALDQLPMLEGYTEFVSDYETNSRKCSSGGEEDPHRHMRALRCSVLWEELVIGAARSGGEEDTEDGDEGEAERTGVVVLAIAGAGAAVLFVLCCQHFLSKSSSSVQPPPPTGEQDVRTRSARAVPQPAPSLYPERERVDVENDRRGRPEDARYYDPATGGGRPGRDDPADRSPWQDREDNLPYPMGRPAGEPVGLSENVVMGKPVGRRTSR